MKERKRFKDQCVADYRETLKGIANSIKQGRHDVALILLDVISECEYSDKLSTYNENEGETLLHLAVKHQDDDSCTSKILTLCPSLLYNAREISETFHGQTALHVAITKGNMKAVSTMFNYTKLETQVNLLHTCATGSRFINTVMMGELPLSVAALKGSSEIVDFLIEKDANMGRQNNYGDTVFHSLIKYAAIYPEKLPDVLDMMKRLHNSIEEKSREYESSAVSVEHFDEDSQDFIYKSHYSYVWFLQNDDSLTPLQLAAKHGLSELFEFILNIKDVYCFVSAHDGLFDVKLYDVSEIDTVCNIHTYKNNRVTSTRSSQRVSPDKLDGISKRRLNYTGADSFSCCSIAQYPDTESVLEMIYSRHYASHAAFRIIELNPVKNVVKSKWSGYQYVFGFWMIVHFAFMTVYTVFGIERSKIRSKSVNATSIGGASHTYIQVFQWFALIFGILYLLISILLIVAKLRRQNRMLYLFHNAEYIMPLLLCSISVIFDIIWTRTFRDSKDSLGLIIALIFGWWFCVFFLSPFQMFSFFAEMVKRVIIGDMLRFGIIILFELIAFTSGMFIIFRGSSVEDQGFESFGDTMLTMFKLGIGLGDIETLYSATIPWVAVTLFVLFLIFTYLLMLNALIAMMSQTCALVLEERYPQWRIQQLSVILLLEDILCLCYIQRFLSRPGELKVVRGWDSKTNHTKKTSRYFLEIHSLQMEYATEEDKERVKKKKEMVTLNPYSSGHEDLGKTSVDCESDIDSWQMSRQQSFKPSQKYLSPPLPWESSPTSVKRNKSSKSVLSPKVPKRSPSLEILEEESLIIESKNRKNKDNFTTESSQITDSLSDRSPKPKRRNSNRKRNKSETLHEKEVRNMGIQHSPPPENDVIKKMDYYPTNMSRMPNGLHIRPFPEIRNYDPST